MAMEVFSYIVFGFLLLRWSMGLLNFIFPSRIKKTSTLHFPSLSILIPARNEAHNLPQLFGQIRRLDYPNLELIFLNDHSQDETEELLRRFCEEEDHLGYINGDPLPQGWLGKNWACHQLSQQAKGEYLLFMDADVNYIDPSILYSGLAHMKKFKLSLLSVFPDQIMVSEGERWVVPLLHYLLMSLLPLRWVFRFSFPSMSAASGQFMLFEGESYRKHRWHEKVRKVIVEDNAIMAEVKKAGLKGMFVLGNGLIRTRMYKDLQEGVRGFSKNILAGFGNSISGLWIYLTLLIPGWMVAVFYLPLSFILLSLFLILSLRGMISYLAGQNIRANLIRHPIQMLVMAWIGILSTLRKIRGKNEWKGRNVQLS